MRTVYKRGTPFASRHNQPPTLVSWLAVLCTVALMAATGISAAGNELSTPVKVPYRHIIPSQLPTDSNGDLDMRQLIVDASAATAPALDEGLDKMLAAVVQALKQDNPELALWRWKKFITATKVDGPHLDANDLVQYVLRKSYLDAVTDLKYRANKVQYFSELKKSIREHHSQMRQMRETLPAGCRNDKELCELIFDIELTIRTLEADLQEPCYGDEELANVELKDALNKHQQTLQVISNVSKQLHDTVMSIIRKMGG